MVRSIPIEQAVNIRGGDVDVFHAGCGRCASISRSDQYFSYLRGPGQRPDQRMLATPTSNHENLHILLLLMTKMTHSGEQHRNVMFVGRRNDFFVANRATGLDNDFHTVLGTNV